MSKKKPLFKPSSKKQSLALSNKSDVFVMGGAAGGGKTFLLMMLILPHIKDDDARIVVVRQTMTQIKQLGNVFDTAKKVFSRLPKHMRPKIREQSAEMIFPDKNGLYNGCKVKFTYLQHEKDLENFQGGQFSLILVDEGTQIPGPFLVYLQSRLRSDSVTNSRMIIATNPRRGHWVHDQIRWYLDDNGYPVEERQGKERYYLRINGETHWGFSPEDLKSRFGEDKRPISFSFVQLLVTDNKDMLNTNPQYLANLEAMSPVDQAIYRWGCWEAQEEGSNYFKREWLEEVGNIPMNATYCRAWDKAGLERTQSKKNPDFTASIGMAKDKDGDFYIFGDYHESVYDDVTETYGRFCKKAGTRDRLIKKQSEHDGTDTVIILPVDPGQAGISEFMHSSRQIAAGNYTVRKDPMPGNKKKLVRFSPFVSACELGMVYIVKNSFDHKTYDAIMTELELFDGGRSTSERHDDYVDACASAFNYLNQAKVIKPITMPSVNAPTTSWSKRL